MLQSRAQHNYLATIVTTKRPNTLLQFCVPVQHELHLYYFMFSSCNIEAVEISMNDVIYIQMIS